MSIIEKNREIISSVTFKDNSPKVSELAAQLSETTDRLDALLSQANAQFKAGDSHATFNKQTIESCLK
jgi:arsenate reductase-like glutaredoxin family protein